MERSFVVDSGLRTGSIADDAALFWVEHGRRRLAVLAGTFAALFALLIALNLVLMPTVELPAPYGDLDIARPRLLYGTFAAVVSLAVVLALRSNRLSVRAILWLALSYEIVLVFAMSVARYVIPFDDDWLPLGVSFACVVIVMFPLIAPTPSTAYTVVGSLAAAATDPLALALATRAGHASPSWLQAMGLVVPTFLCAGLAIVPAAIIRRLGHDARRARELGSYRLTHCIGAGGMGEVWRAEHRLLARPAAIKIVRPERLGHPERAERIVRRFEREAQATAALTSPHVIDLFDFGLAQNGSFYYVMELLEGIDLQSLVERHGPLPAERVVFLLRQVCDALIDAHDAGLIHRDIKPANVFACRYGYRYDYIKVMDFGLVAETEPAANEPRLTADNVTPGTPAFLAPEAATGEGPIDGRLDLYGLGCTAYWLLTARLVFDGKTALQLAARHIQDAPVPPSQRTELEVPAELDALVLALLAKHPEQRPPSARAVLRQLEEIAGQLERSWDAARAGEWWRENQPVPVADELVSHSKVVHLVPRLST
jgi:serine/threonine-protein kinase